MTIALLCAVVQGAWAWSGSGTADSPYILSTGDDWATFVNQVNAGTDADKHYKLADTCDFMLLCHNLTLYCDFPW